MATELGKAYVQIVPSAQGISGKISSALRGESQSAGTSSGQLVGTNLVSKLKTIIAAAGIGKAIKASISEGAKLEQSLGGVETLFKKNADLVVKNAREAYKTAGVSANEYMEGVTSFAASLLQSTAGDTKKATEISDMAFRDMSDNANKMGSNMGDIQNAYQGFAKQNYTMLDNLKLGYGGTKSEMERLLKDAQQLTGVKYDINNLSDVYQAIHAIQGKLDITGTTAKEAATTVSGSFGQMKAAFTDVLRSLAIGENVKESFSNLAVTVKTFVFDNLIPMIGEIFKNIPEGLMSFATTMGPLLIEEGTKLVDNLSQGFTTGLPKLITKAGEIITKLIDGFTQNAPKIIKSGVELIKNLGQGLIDNIPMLIEKAGEIVLKLAEAVITVAPQLLSAGIELVTSLATGFYQKYPEILAKMGEFLVNLVKLIIDKAPEFLAKGKELINKLKEGFLQVKEAAKQALVTILTAVLEYIKSKAGEFLNKGKELIGKLKEGFHNKKEELINKAKEIIKGAKDAVAKFITDFVNVGRDIIGGIVKGISDAASKVSSAVSSAVSGAVGWAKKKLKINSPSKVFAKEIGQWIPAGIAKGISGNLGPIGNSMLAVAKIATDPTIKNEISKFVPTIKEKIKNDAPTLYEAGSRIVNKIQESISNKKEDFKNTGKNIVVSVKTGVQDSTGNLLGAIKTSASKGVETLTSSCSNFTTAGQKITIAIKEGIGSKGLTIVIQIGDIMKETVDKIKSYDGKLNEEGKNVVEKVKQGVKAKKPDLINSIKSMMESALNTAKSIGQKFNSVFGSSSGAVANVGLRATSQFMGAGVLGTATNLVANTIPMGKAVSQGFSKGVQNQTPNVLKTVKDLGVKTIGKFKSLFGIHSPSKVFYEFGSYIAEGLALGIGDNFNLVNDALSEMDEAPNVGMNKKFKVSSDYSNDFIKNETKDKGINLNLSIGGQTFKAFVDRISLEQDKDIELRLAY